MRYGHEKRFYKILKIRFFQDFYTKCIPQKTEYLWDLLRKEIFQN